MIYSTTATVLLFMYAYVMWCLPEVVEVLQAAAQKQLIAEKK
jgi:hypothetical protein